MDHGMSRAKSPRGDLIYIAPNVESSEAFVRFDSKPVVHGDSKLLFAPEVPQMCCSTFANPRKRGDTLKHVLPSNRNVIFAPVPRQQFFDLHTHFPPFTL